MQSKGPKWIKHLTTIGLCVTLIGTFLAYLHTAVLVGAKQAHPEVSVLPLSESCSSRQPVSDTPSLRVMTLNVAHGRKEALHQVFQSASTIEANLGLTLFPPREIDFLAEVESCEPEAPPGCQHLVSARFVAIAEGDRDEIHRFILNAQRQQRRSQTESV